MKWVTESAGMPKLQALYLFGLNVLSGHVYCDVLKFCYKFYCCLHLNLIYAIIISRLHALFFSVSLWLGRVLWKLVFLPFYIVKPEIGLFHLG